MTVAACAKCGGAWCSVDRCLPATRQPTPAPADDAEVRDGWKLVPVGAPVSLAACPPGPFLFDGSLGFKTEYGAMETVGPTNVPGSQIRWAVGRAPDAYCIDSGEHFWGGAKSKDARAALIVQPLAASPKAPSVAIGAGEVERLLETGENLTVAFAELGDGSWTDEKREAYTAFCRALEAAATVALPAVGAGVSDRINAAFDEDINDQASRLGVKPVATESPGWWQQRVRKAAVLAALAPASASGVDRAVALVRRIAARESWQSHYGRRWEDEAAEIVAEIDGGASASIPADVERLPVARIHEQIDEGGAWRACSGCQESVDGYVSARDYPYSKAYRCQPGGGCSECGGIGVVWDAPGYWDGLWDEPSTTGDAALAARPSTGEKAS